MDIKALHNGLPRQLLKELPQLRSDAATIANDIRRNFAHTFGCNRHSEAAYPIYKSLAVSLRDRLMKHWNRTNSSYEQLNCKVVYFLSMEYLMGRTLSNTLSNLGITEETMKALQSLNLCMEEIIEAERESGLGNGGLGRFAACLLDSCATLQLPVMGYGIRYEYGLFRQLIENGEQIEEPDNWLLHGNPWEVERTELIQRVHFGGHVEEHMDENGYVRHFWVETGDVLAIPYDLPVPGYRNETVNTLRLWRAMPVEEFKLQEFNAGDYFEAIGQRAVAENLSKVLYPDDTIEMGRILRLRQQYFLTSASIQDVVHAWVRDHGSDFTHFADKVCFQLNDTQPAIAVAELMRLLTDVHSLEWEQAWQITNSCMAYTNHSMLPEALEEWPVSQFRNLLPRLLEIIFEINARFLAEVSKRWPGDNDRLRRMSLIEEKDDGQQVRMAYLAIVGSFSVNGVAELHTKLLKEGLFKNFYDLWPEKFNNKTNGVTQRRFLALANPDLSDLITDALGDDSWITNVEQLRQLTPLAEQVVFRQRWHEVKRKNKERLAGQVAITCDVHFNPDALFDVQVTRIHEYKRQILNVLHVIHLYDRIKRGDTQDWTPRCVLFAGKAAPGYFLAKMIIKLVNNVANIVNNDLAIGDLLKLAFLTDYGVSSMEIIVPGTDLSSQISAVGKDAAGTSNMKFMMNGALTIGTLDGTNIEIREEVGDENFFLFGLTAEEVEAIRQNYDPKRIIREDEDLSRVIQLLESGHFNQYEPGIFDSIIKSILSPFDPWLTAADFRSFVEAQKRAAQAYKNPDHWTRMSIINTAYSGRFSIDRTTREYNAEIWNTEEVIPSITGDF